MLNLAIVAHPPQLPLSNIFLRSRELIEIVGGSDVLLQSLLIVAHDAPVMHDQQLLALNLPRGQTPNQRFRCSAVTLW